MKGCEHYGRKCKFVAPCCNKTYWCRFCHDETECGPDVVMKTPKLAHKTDRFQIRRIVCQACDTEQDVKAKCEKCDVSFAKYVCLKCNLFDEDDSKGQYHCDKCGICRVGGKSNFFHCDTCGTCFRSNVGHVCVERATHSDCPVCMEFMFSSREPSVALRCGHVIHLKCQEQLLERGVYKCPLCSKSFLTRKQMKGYFRVIDEAIASTEMPEEYRNKRIRVHCNDCNQSSMTLFHFHGLKCTALVPAEASEEDDIDSPKQESYSPKNSTKDGVSGSETEDKEIEDGVKNSSTHDAEDIITTVLHDDPKKNIGTRADSKGCGPSKDALWEICGSYNTRRD